MPADPVAAGRKGGQSKSAAKLAACKRNGFQRAEKLPPVEEMQPAAPTPENGPALPLLLVVPTEKK